MKSIGVSLALSPCLNYVIIYLMSEAENIAPAGHGWAFL
jgi:hypothetical protein